jgi:hypothetical protein
VTDRIEDVGVPTAVRREVLVRMVMVVGGVVDPPRDGHDQAAGHRRQEPDLVLAGHRRIETRQVADILSVHVDVHEPVEIARIGQQLPAEGRVLLDEAVHHGPDRVAVDHDGLGAAHVRTEHRRDVDGAHARASGRRSRRGRSSSALNGASPPTLETASGDRRCGVDAPRRSRPGTPAHDEAGVR